MEDLQSCETRAAGSWTAFMALAGVCPALAQALDSPDRPSESQHSVFFAWALLLAYVCAETTSSEVCLATVHRLLSRGAGCCSVPTLK
jgi:hypothetical protein